MSLIARFVPIHRPGETLWEGLKERPCLEMQTCTCQQKGPAPAPSSSGTCPLALHQLVLLGRSRRTGIMEPTVSRHVARIEWNATSKELRLHCLLSTNQGALLHNGTVVRGVVVLKEGDSLSIGPNEPVSPLTQQNQFSYRVQVVQEGESLAAAAGEESQPETQPLHAAGSAATSTSTTATTVPAPPRPLLFQANGVAEEVQCAVCMELCVQTTALVPCSHLFCAGCASSLRECPSCRHAVTSTLGLPIVDKIIYQLLQKSCSSVTDTNVASLSREAAHEEELGDVTEYLQRTHQTLPPSSKEVVVPSSSPTDVQLLSPTSRRKRRRKQNTRKPAPGMGAGTSAQDAICID